MAGRRSRRRWWLAGLGALLVVAVAAAGVYLRPIAPIATGYAAKILCSGHFVSGRAVGDVEGDLPANPLVPFLRLDVDEDAGVVEASLLGLSPSRAYFTPGYGCSLSSSGRPELPSLDPPPPLDGARPWPQGEGLVPLPPEVDGGALAATLDAAFSEDPADAEQGRVRGTRAVVVAHGGRIVAERYAEGFDAATPLLGWSMTKSVANALVGVLVERGELSLDDAELVSAWPQDDPRAAITLDQLLHMSSGLDFEEVYEPPSDVTAMLFASDDVSARAAQEDLVAEPGSRWSYSSGTSNILCEVVQDALGGGPGTAAFAREAVFEPLAMTSAVLEPDAGGGLVCSSFAYATARDWARFGQLYLDDGVWQGERLLPEGWVEYTTTPVELEADNPYGAHWWLNAGPQGDLRLPRVPADAYWASGNEGQFVVVVPSADQVVVRLGLTVGYADSIEWGLEDLVAGAVAAVGP
jgi:hypothetical protein